MGTQKRIDSIGFKGGELARVFRLPGDSLQAAFCADFAMRRGAVPG